MPRETTTMIPRRRLISLGAGLTAVGVFLLALGLVAPLIVAVRVLLALAGVVTAFSGVSRLVWGLRRQRVDLLPWVCLAWLAVLIVAAVLAPVLPLKEHRDVAATLLEPVYLEPLRYYDHPLGTNSAGLDMLARCLYGARTSLTVSLLAVTIGTVLGGAIGVIAGYYRRGVDSVIGVLTNALLAVPPLILLIALSTLLEPSIRNMVLVLSLLTVPSMIRLARANTISFRQREFVFAAEAMGAGRLRIMARELVPNVLPPLLSMAVVVISGLIVAEASLSFLGLGVRPPEPTWGNMIAEAQGGVLQKHPSMVLVPGTFLFLTVFAFNVLGEKAQKRWNPRSAAS
ncbi:ABC transporter permease [Sphaerimonospora thailandensis]|nr:ABC transporter permease [Sphaerimonospora thailandensis]